MVDVLQLPTNYFSKKMIALEIFHGLASRVHLSALPCICIETNEKLNCQTLRINSGNGAKRIKFKSIVVSMKI